MPRRLNYTGRKKINRADVSIRLQHGNKGLLFDATLRLADYKLDQITPAPRVYIEAYRGAAALWKRFDFGRVGAIRPPADRSLDEFRTVESILFRVKVTAEGGEDRGKLLAEADAIRPRLPSDEDIPALPLLQHMPADDIGDELWRLTGFDDTLPLLKINSRIPMGVDQFLLNPHYRAIFAPAIMREVLTRILIIDQDTGVDTDETDWRQRWIKFAETVGASECPGTAHDNNLRLVENWIDEAVEAFVGRAGLFPRFAPQTTQEVHS